MSLAWFRQTLVRISGLVLIGMSSSVHAGEAMAPLRVDPTLLGGAPLKPVTQPETKSEARPAEKPAEKSAEKPAAPTTQKTPTQPAPAAATVEPRPGVEVTPVAPPPAARDLPKAVAPPVPVKPPVAAPQATPRPVAQPTTPPAAAAPVVATVSAQNLPPLRVDPALLGGAPLVARPASGVVPAGAVPGAPQVAAAVPVRKPIATPAAQGLPPLRVDPALLGENVAVALAPPQVADRPAVPALYSAHLAAGLIPHPATTPMSHVDKASAPTFVTANRIGGINDVEMIAEGQAELVRAGDALRAEQIRYRVAEDEVESTGNVILSAPDMEVRGPRMRMRMEESTGEFESPAYVISKKQNPVPEPAITISGLPATDDKGKVLVGTGRMIALPPIIGSGEADRLEFRGKDLYHLKNASYSTCAPGKRDWSINVDELDLDYTSEQGSGRGAAVRFLDVPIFYSPWLSFPLNNERKSGFLPATIGTSNKSGFEVSAPWYWNIAPDMDATIMARAMSRRGLQISTEFRHLLDTPWNRKPHRLSSPDNTEINLEYLPDDKLYGQDRYGYSVRYHRHLTDNLKAELNLNGVSDDAYFSDLSTRVAQVTQGNLLRQGKLIYRSAWYGATLNAQTFQSLQNNVVGNYRRLPQITAYANRHDLPLGLAFDFNGEYVNFDHPTELLGKRTTLYPQVSLPLSVSAFTVTPKIGIHSTQYDLSGQNRLAAGDYRKNVPDQLNRTLPILSIDGGFAMEREFDWLGKSMTQTLEPRAYYLLIPKHDQSKIPVFDTALSSFNYAQIFSENRYAGGDRIGDANHLTLAVTSRFLDTASGSDLLRATLGTRYYFTEQSVVLPAPFGETLRTERKADILAALSGQVLPNIYADIGWQYNPREVQTERLSFGGRYRPSSGQILNASYRIDRSTDLKQFDVSGQWPLFGGWQGVGRYNYSINEHRVIESIGGVEYNAGCWVGRFVVQRLATIAEKPTTAVFFQLELNDFSKIGSNPLQLLHRNIPGYGVISPATADPLFATPN